MPYIPKENYGEAKIRPKTTGEVAYALTIECLKYLENNTENFETHAEIISALSQPFEGDYVDGNAKNVEQLKGKLDRLAKKSQIGHNRIKGVYTAVLLEWYRRMTLLYENEKCSLNGDVYPKGNVDIAIKRILKLTTSEIIKINDRISALEQENQTLQSPKIFKPKDIKRK